MTIFIFLIFGLFTSFLFPPYFIFPLGFIIFPFLCFYFDKNLKKLNKKKIFINCFAFGATFFGSFLIWMQSPFYIFEETRYLFFLSLIFIIFLSILFSTIFTLIIFYNKLTPSFFSVPIIFVLTEFIISNIFSGFPWVTFSLIVSNIELFSYIFKYFGTFLTSYIVLQVYCIPYYFFSKNERLNVFRFSFFVTLPLVLIILSTQLIYKPINNEEILNVEIFQINKSASINKNLAEKELSILLDLISKSKSQLLVFAENNYPYLINNFDFHRIQKNLKADQTVIIGGTRIQEGKYFNTMFSINTKEVNFFDKIQLVPFGEFLPFRKFLGFFEPISGSNYYIPGTKERIIIEDNYFSFIPVICYEIIFYWKLFNSKNSNSNLIINITNDLWFGNYFGPYQHLYLTKIRAAEFNKFLIRVSNNGISAIINNKGQIIKNTKLFERTNLSYKIKLQSNQNYYFIHNLLNIYLCILFFIFIIINIKRNYA